MKMFGCVPVRRAVATADVAAGHAKAQMNPGSTNAQAILAAIGAWYYLSDLI